MNDDLQDDLYGDLEDAGLQVEVQKLKHSLSEEQKKSKLVRDENAQLKEQMNCLVVDSKQLEKNIMAVYNTALREVKRKDKEILKLRQEVQKYKAK
jgi:hypothetical protein